MEPSSRPGTFGSGSATGRPGVVIVPLDGSTGSRAALPLATYLSTAFGAPLHRVSVTLPTDTAPGRGREAHADALSLLRGRTPASRPPVAQTWTASGGPPPPPSSAANVVGVVSADGDVEVVLEGASVATALGDYAARHPDALVCMATHARGGLHRRLVGNVVEELLEQARFPVIAVGPQVEVEATAQRPETILLAAGAELPRSTVPLLASWARLLGAQVVVARVAAPARPVGSGPSGDGWDDRAVADRLVSRFAQHRTPAMAKRLHGDSVPLALLELAEQIGGPLLLAAPVTPYAAPPVSGITHELLQRSRWPVVASVGGTS